MSIWGSLFGAVFGRKPGAQAPAPARPATPAPPAPQRAGGFLAQLQAQSRAPLTRADFEASAARLGCEWEALAAAAEVQSAPSGAFAADGRPTILFERHLFSRHTNSRFDASNPNVSNRTPGGYPPGQAERWAQLAEAFALDAEAALRSTSFGRFQLLGLNFASSGAATARDYAAKLSRSERDQLEAFEGFVRARGLGDELQRRDWTGFASRYNGPGYAVSQYDMKMAQAYARLKSNPVA